MLKLSGEASSHALAGARPPAALDPLGADRLLAHLPALNRLGDVASLTTILDFLLLSADTIARFDESHAIAAMRDLGIVAGSIRRHGVEPCAAIDELEPVLIALGRRTGMIPRDTVHHYSEWNPAGERERRYTDDPQESALIDAVRQCAPHLGRAARQLVAVAPMDPRDPVYAAKLRAAAGDVDALVGAIRAVMGSVSPAWFVTELRPYFDPIEVAGHSYHGPAAAHLPIWLVDLPLWATDRADPAHAAFLAEVRIHTLPRWQRLAEQASGRASIVTRVTAELERSGARPGPAVVESAAALRQLLHSLVAFRGKHLTIARRAYRAELTDYRVGSGGATTELLASILELTRTNEMSVAPEHRRCPVRRGTAPAAASERATRRQHAPGACPARGDEESNR